MSIVYRPSETLSRFMASDAFVRAVVGPIGSGKSSGCIVELLRRAAQQAPDAKGRRRTRWAVIRNTYSQLRDTTRKTFEQWVPADLGQWREQEFSFVIDRPLEDGTQLDCEVLFRALDRPQDVGKVLSLELTGAYINEARELPKEILDGLQGRLGRYPANADGGATWFGLWMDSNPWPTSHWAYDLFNRSRPGGFELFEQPGGREPNAENIENLPKGYYERLVHGKDAEWVLEYVDAKYPSSDRGSVYGAVLDRLEQRGGLALFDHPADGVNATFDLGISDATAIWWWRSNGHGGVDLLDWYEANGEPLSHFVEVMRQRAWKLRRVFLPHDARARTFQTGVSTLDQMMEAMRPVPVAIGPELSLEDGISATRWLFEQNTRIHPRCADGIKRLRAYRYEWDEGRKCFTKKPLHDWTSHTADSARYVACVAQHEANMLRKAPAVKRDMVQPIRLDDLFAANEKPTNRGRV